MHKLKYQNLKSCLKLKCPNLKCGLNCNFPFLLLPHLLPQTLGFFIFLLCFNFPADNLAGEEGPISSPAKQQQVREVPAQDRRSSSPRPAKQQPAQGPASSPAKLQRRTCARSPGGRRSSATPSPVLGDPPNSPAREIKWREREKSGREIPEERERKKGKEREWGWGPFLYEGFLVISQKHGY